MKFTIEELKTIAMLFEKAQLVGREALPIAMLMQKVGQMIQELEKSPADSVTNPKRDGTGDGTGIPAKDGKGKK